MNHNIKKKGSYGAFGNIIQGKMKTNRLNFLLERVRAMVAVNPQKVAVKDKMKMYSYEELWIRVQNLAIRLKGVGLQKGERVAFFMENNVDYVVGILATFMNGGIFVPISNKYPEERVYTIIDNCTPHIVLVNNISMKEFGNVLKQIDISIINVDDIMFRKISGQIYESLTGKDVAYIIYTSGSTGIPKGVAIKWESLENYIKDTNKRLDFDHTSVSLNMTSFCFDGSLTSVFCMLFCGGTLVIASPFIMRANQFCNLIKCEGITDLGCTPVQLSFLANALENDNLNDYKIKTIAIGGENFSAEYVKRIFRCLKDVKILNRYGPTETTIVSSSYEIQQDDLTNNKPIPIGKPISNTIFYAINEKNKPICSGETGELYIGGISVMSGYWNDSELTDRVITKSLINGVRMYRTGDLVTIDDRGNYIFVSRIDDMVKIKGYRIYLSEIDNAIVNINGVLDSCSIVSAHNEKKDIISYVICESTAGCSDELNIKRELLKVLPAYMLPRSICFIEKFPVTNNGKIDKKKLERMTIGQNNRFEKDQL